METLGNIFIWIIFAVMLIMALVDVSTIIQGKHNKNTLNSLYQASTILFFLVVGIFFDVDSMFEAPYYLKVFIALVIMIVVTSFKPFGKE